MCDAGVPRRDDGALFICSMGVEGLVLILGWHGGVKAEWQDLGPGWSTHDGAAVLIRDGRVIEAVEEERLNRVKHSNFFPGRAIRRCLQSAGVTLSDVDVVAMNFSERTRRTFPADPGLPSADSFLEDPSAPHATVREQIADLFLREFGVDISRKLHFCDHHLAHLWSAWGLSGFDESLVVSLDGSGDARSGMIAIGQRGGLRVVRELSVAQSLGNLYSDSIRLLGYKRFDEYKVMGLAPYGDAGRFASLFGQFFVLLPDGDYRIVDREERWSLIHDAGLFPSARRRGEPFSPLHRDFAAALQRTLETVVLHVMRHFVAETKQRKLCYAGGVAHNCTLNGRLLYEGLFDEVFVQPAAHDAGGALGAAIEASVARGVEMTAGLPHLFLGSELSSGDALAAQIEPWDALVRITRLADPIEETARLLEAGHVVGWVQGRSEFGPRALGNRSILADPRPAENKARINEMVKKREEYRPFAPSVLEDHLGQVVELPATRANMSFMTYTLNVCAPASPQRWRRSSI